jgi:hypothetical protein
MTGYQCVHLLPSNSPAPMQQRYDNRQCSIYFFDSVGILAHLKLGGGNKPHLFERPPVRDDTENNHCTGKYH